MGCAVLRCRHRPGGGRKVDDHIGLGQFFKAGINRYITDFSGFAVHTGHHTAVLTGRNFFDQRMAHTAINSLEHNIRHFPFPFKKSPQQVATGRSA